MAMNATVRIRVALREGITRLGENYYTPPFKVANITEDKKDVVLHLMLMCSSPGILDGDVYDIRLELGAGSQLQWHTQSYQRLFQMEKGARQSMEVRLGPGAFFCYLPHPCVPHAHSIFTSTSKIYLGEGAQLVWGEVLTCGRRLNGELFQFSKYHTMTEIFRDHSGGERTEQSTQLLLRENIHLQPSVMDLRAPGQLEGYTHQASLFFIGGGRPVARRQDSGGYTDEGRGNREAQGDKIGMDTSAGMRDANARREELRQKVQDYLGAESAEMLSAVSTGPAGSLVVRMLGYRAEQLYDCLKAIAGILSFTKPLVDAG